MIPKRSRVSEILWAKGKIKHQPAGYITKELTYGRRDVERTVALLNKMKREYDGFPLRLEPEWAMS